MQACEHTAAHTCMRPPQQRPQSGWRASQGLSAAPSATAHLSQAPLALRAVRRRRCGSCAARQARQMRERGSMARPPGFDILNLDGAPTVHRNLPSDLVSWRISSRTNLWCYQAILRAKEGGNFRHLHNILSIPAVIRQKWGADRGLAVTQSGCQDSLVASDHAKAQVGLRSTQYRGN